MLASSHSCASCKLLVLSSVNFHFTAVLHSEVLRRMLSCRRARYLLEGAQHIVNKLGGKFPETAAEVTPGTCGSLSGIALSVVLLYWGLMFVSLLLPEACCVITCVHSS
jgi:hypothetical protein